MVDNDAQIQSKRWIFEEKKVAIVLYRFRECSRRNVLVRIGPYLPIYDEKTQCVESRTDDLR